MRETTALGAAIAAGFAIGVWKNFDELQDINRFDRVVFTPNIPSQDRDRAYARWQHAVKMATGWLQPDTS